MLDDTEKVCVCVNIHMCITYISLIERHSKMSTTGECSLSYSNLSTGWKLFKLKMGGEPSGSLKECAGALRLGESCVTVLCGAWRTVGTLQTEAAWAREGV